MRAPRAALRAAILLVLAAVPARAGLDCDPYMNLALMSSAWTILGLLPALALRRSVYRRAFKGSGAPGWPAVAASTIAAAATVFAIAALFEASVSECVNPFDGGRPHSPAERLLELLGRWFYEVSLCLWAAALALAAGAAECALLAIRRPSLPPRVTLGPALLINGACGAFLALLLVLFWA